VNIQHVILATSVALMAVGVYGLTSSNNLVRQLLSIEILFNGILLLMALIASINSSMLTLLMIVMVSVVSGEVIIVMTLVISMYRTSRTLTSDVLEERGV